MNYVYFLLGILCASKSVLAMQAEQQGSVDINADDREGYSALHHAVLNGDETEVQLLLAQKAFVDEPTMQGKNTPLHCAVDRKQVNIITMLLAAKANINARNVEGNTALHSAAQSTYVRKSSSGVEYEHYSATIVALLESKAFVDMRNKQNRTSLYYVCANTLWTHKALESLIYAGGDYHHLPFNMGYPLRCAIKEADTIVRKRAAGLCHMFRTLQSNHLMPFLPSVLIDIIGDYAIDSAILARNPIQQPRPINSTHQYRHPRRRERRELGGCVTM